MPGRLGLGFFLTGVAETASGAIEAGNRLVGLFREDRKRITQKRGIVSIG
ncbi:MAG: hypothetical protein OXC91_02160 [Rhodobacteraceae bacterium]|nr:hypothetical protein [Paracoccaceae bacterium]